MTIKEKYKKAGFKFEVEEQSERDDVEVLIEWWLLISTQYFMSFKSEAEAWSWVEKNFPLPDIEAISSKWHKRLKPIESSAITATAQQIEINKRQQEIGEQRIITEILSDLGEK